MLHRLYMRTLALAASPRAPWWLAVVAFAESSFFPIPPDALLIPMVLARPDRAWRLAAICTVASVVGGALGYAIGYFVFDQLMRLPLAHTLFGPDPLGAFQAWYARWGLAVILIKGLTPIPYKIVTIASGRREVRLPGVHGRQHRHARRALLPGGGAAARVRHPGARLHRAAADPGHQHARRRHRWRLPGIAAALVGFNSG